MYAYIMMARLQSMKSQSTLVSITNQNRMSILCSHAVATNTFLSRLIGLLGSTTLPHGSGLLIRPSSGVHTCGMRYPLDILALDGSDRVLGAWSHTPPWCVRGISFKTRSMLELPPGTIYMSQTVPGDQLHIDSSEEPNCSQQIATERDQYKTKP